MIGFFEYQYLKYKKSHLRNLVALARVDGHVHDKELEFLHEIGKKYQLKDWQITQIVNSTHQEEPMIPEAHVQKIGQLYDIVGMMMADNVIEESEMDFCRKMFTKFGYKVELIDQMVEMQQNELIQQPEEWEFFVDKAESMKI